MAPTLGPRSSIACGTFRPVNTALTNPFDLYTPARRGGLPRLGRHHPRIRYNLDGDSTNWVATWGVGGWKLHLGIFDALDDKCGTQAGYGALSPGPNYTVLSSVAGR